MLVSVVGLMWLCFSFCSLRGGAGCICAKQFCIRFLRVISCRGSRCTTTVLQPTWYGSSGADSEPWMCILCDDRRQPASPPSLLHALLALQQTLEGVSRMGACNTVSRITHVMRIQPPRADFWAVFFCSFITGGRAQQRKWRRWNDLRFP